MKPTTLNNKPYYTKATPDTPFDKDQFHEILDDYSSNVQHALHTDIGSLTVLDRMTGSGWRDVETGYRDIDGNFWLACGDQDVRTSGAKTLGEAIEWVKANATHLSKPT